MEFRIGFCSAAESKHAHANFTVQPVFQYVYIYMNLISFISPQKKDAKYVSEQLSLALWATFCDKWPQVSTAFRCGFCIYCWLAGLSWPFFLRVSNPWRWAPALVTGHWLSLGQVLWRQTNSGCGEFDEESFCAVEFGAKKDVSN